LYFDESTVTQKIRYQYPYKAIFYDEDGSLTELGPHTWATVDWRHLRQPQCLFDEYSLKRFGGIVCDWTVQVRRVAFHGVKPDYFKGMIMKIAPFDEDQVE
jgi:hypothetical protein